MTEPPTVAAAPEPATEPAGGEVAPTNAGHRRRYLVIAAAVAAAIAVAALAVGVRAHPPAAGPPAGSPVSALAEPTRSTGLSTVDPENAGGPPTRVRIPAIGVDSGLQPLHLDKAGVLVPPTSYTEAGWYADGPLPGDVGPAVLAGHVDSKSGPGVFLRLLDLTAGSEIQVDRGGQWLSFHVVRVSRYPKNAFPTTQVYGPTPDAELRLITCGGAFDRKRGSYIDNVVVFAVQD